MNFHHPSILSDSSAEPVGPLTFRTNTSEDNPNVIVQGPFYRVSRDISRAPIDDFLEHGYETRKEFRQAISLLIGRWGGREGECIEERCYHGDDGEAIDQRHRQLHLQFHDTPGGRPDEAWIPLYLLDSVPAPDYARWHEFTTEELTIDELDRLLWKRSH